jgi:DnaJ-class molecular chaperone
VLGVASGATPADRFRGHFTDRNIPCFGPKTTQKAKQIHPDVAGNSASNRAKFLELQQAYETLRDPQRRTAYDQMLRRYKSGGNQQSKSRYQSAGGWGAGSAWEQADQQQQSYYQQQQQHYSQQQRFSEADLEEAYLAGYHTGQKEATATTKTFKTAGSTIFTTI